MTTRPFTLAFILVFATSLFAMGGLAQAEGWGDSLKGAADAAVADATKPATDTMNEANAKVDDTAAKVESAKKVAANPTDSMTETAKRAAGKGVQSATDSVVGGATVTDSAKTGAAAAVQEAMGTGTPAPPVSAPAPAAAAAAE